jgi:ABC-2 type transport system permease protein
MQVYRAYFKVIKKHSPILLVYFIAFALTSLIITAVISGQTSSDFTAVKSKIAVFNEDGDAPLSAGLAAYLTENARLVSIQDDPESIRDALFYGDADCILRIPAGFSEEFMRGGASKLQQTTSASTYAGISLHLLIEKYLNIAEFYRENVPGMEAGQIVRNVEHDLRAGADVQWKADQKQSGTRNLSIYFRFSAYPILAVLIMGITTIMLVFQQKDLSRRNLCAPLSMWRMNLQLFLGNASFAVIVWILISILNMALYGQNAAGFSVVLLWINALIFTVVSLSIGFLAGKYLKSGVAVSAFTNVAALGISFISGIFVDQILLSPTVLKIASFLPGYWYVRATDSIRDLSDFSLPSLTPIIYDMLIQLGFAAAFFVLALAVSKQKRVSQA